MIWWLQILSGVRNMPLIIGTAAYVVLCPRCGEHGSIVFANGRVSVPFYSQEVGLVITKIALSLDLLHISEVPELTRQIGTVGLPYEPQTEDISTAEEREFASDNEPDPEAILLDETEEKSVLERASNLRKRRLH